MRSYRFSRYLSVAAFSALASISAPSLAQDEPQNIQPAIALNRFNPAPAGDRLFGVPSPFVTGHMNFAAMLLFNYAHDPLVLRRLTDDGGSEKIASIVGNQMFAHVNATLELWERLGVNIDLPLALYQSGDSPKVDSSEFISPDGFQLSDLRLGVRGRVLGQGTDAFQLAVGGYIWFPTGNGDPGSFVGDGTVRGLPQVMVGGYLDRLVYSAAIGPEFRQDTRIANASQGMMFQGSAGAGYMLGDSRALQVGGEISFATVLTDATSRNTNFELMVDAKYRVHRLVEVGLGIAPGLARGIGTPDLRVVAMAAYVPVPAAACKDTDGDKVCDSDDACLSEAGVASEDPKKNGCPEMKDKDGDKIADKDDACVDVPGVKNDDPKKNGCPPDKDGDTIIDKDDACPDEPGEKNDDPKKNGCPGDKDEDKIYDKDDACPDVPGEKNDDPKKNGCPPDKDGDTIADKDDACPDIPGVKTSDPKTNGCPGDTDGDTIRDDKDACPNEKGKPNDDPTKNGCPTAVRVTEKEIIILQQVQFDTNKATIKPVSNPLLDEVAGVLKEHPEILKLEVQGHTDNKGSAKLNEKLSQNRAESVMKALAKRGIDAGRMTAKGYGPNQPIDTNDTDAGRQKNRRVQFVIQDRKPKAPPAQ